MVKIFKVLKCSSAMHWRVCERLSPSLRFKVCVKVQTSAQFQDLTVVAFDREVGTHCASVLIPVQLMFACHRTNEIAAHLGFYYSKNGLCKIAFEPRCVPSHQMKLWLAKVILNSRQLWIDLVTRQSFHWCLIIGAGADSCPYGLSSDSPTAWSQWPIC